MLEFDAGDSLSLMWQTKECCRCNKVLSRGTIRWSCGICKCDYCGKCAAVSGYVQDLGDFMTTPKADMDVSAFVSVPSDLEVTKSTPMRPCDAADMSMTLTASAPAIASSISDAAPIGPACGASSAVESEPPKCVANSRRESRIRRRSSIIEARHDELSGSLTNVPFLGTRPLGRIQTDAIKRLSRLLDHGDIRGAQCALARARLLSVDEADIEALALAVQLLALQDRNYLLLESGSES